MPQPQFDADTMGDSRDYVVLNCREGVDPRGAIDDYGDFDKDHNDPTETRSDPGTPTYEETEAFYDSYRPEDIRINGR